MSSISRSASGRMISSVFNVIADLVSSPGVRSCSLGELPHHVFGEHPSFPTIGLLQRGYEEFIAHRWRVHLPHRFRDNIRTGGISPGFDVLVDDCLYICWERDVHCPSNSAPNPGASLSTRVFTHYMDYGQRNESLSISLSDDIPLIDKWGRIPGEEWHSWWEIWLAHAFSADLRWLPAERMSFLTYLVLPSAPEFASNCLSRDGMANVSVGNADLPTQLICRPDAGRHLVRGRDISATGTGSGRSQRIARRPVPPDCPRGH